MIHKTVDDSYSDSDTDSDLDTSWMKDHEKLESVQSNYSKERLENIDIFFLFINANEFIEKIVCENHPLSFENSDNNKNNNNNSVLKKETILQLIQSKKKATLHSKYKFMDILTYNVDLESEHVQNFAKSENLLENSKHFFKVLPIVDDIIIPPSIFIFHGVNALYFLFKEQEIDVSQISTKSILKTDANSSRIKNTNTKKVKIVLNKLGLTKKHRE